MTMVGIILVCATFVCFQDAEPKAPGGTRGAARDDRTAASLAKYNQLKAKTAGNAAAQWKLALWCEENGLAAEAVLHYSVVVELDPRRDAAWKKLGYKKFGGQWMTDAQIAIETRQKEAEALWLPKLKKIHKDIHGKHGAARQEDARAALDAIADANAVPAVYKEFVGGDERDQVIAVRVLGQIEAAVATKTLALISVYGKSPEVRRRAAETLRGRDSRDYLELLVGLMADPYRYEVKSVGGPGSPGVLFVEGERYNMRRFYDAPVAPNIQPRPGDIISYDGFGLPVITRPLGPIAGTKVGVPGSKTLAYETNTAVRYSALQGQMAAQQASAVSQANLESDVERIEAINKDRTVFNELVMAVAKNADGKDRGRSPKQWRDSLAAEGKYAPKATPTDGRDAKRTVDELIPSGVNPMMVGEMTFTRKLIVDT